jgi:adenosylhomocysteine nucleosidase
MPRTTILVPHGAEAEAVRRARPAARVAELPAGAAAARALPEFEPGETAFVLGLCGALWRLQAGAVVIYGRVVDAANAFELDPHLVDELTGALPHASVANACTTKRVVTTVTARTVLAQRFNADVVDMEGTHLAAALAARGVRFAMVRVVSDDASRDLPPLDGAIDAQGRIQPMPVALAFARAPLAALAFVRDVRSSLAVLTETARAISRVPA